MQEKDQTEVSSPKTKGVLAGLMKGKVLHPVHKVASKKKNVLS